MALATALSQSGFIKWAAAFIANGIAGAHMGWISSFLIISLIYIYSHYCFASVTARISAMYAAFVAVAAACGAPALMVAVAFGIFANLPISLTHYGNGAVPRLFRHRLREPERMVAQRLHRLHGQHRRVAHRRHDLVETHRPLVTGA